jgi:chaperonin cofactor prefoldin
VKLAVLSTKIDSLEKKQDAIFKSLEEMPDKIVENLKNTKGLL